jgi:AraC-like DNA-binding protein
MKVVTLSEADLEKVKAAARIIADNPKYHYKIPDLSERVLLNVKKLKQGFKELYGTGPYAYLLHLRMERAKEMLLENATIRTIARATGYTGSNAETNFIRIFKKQYQQSPAAWKRQQYERDKSA